MSIDHGLAINLEMIVRKVFACERSGMGGYIDADHFESAPFDAALIALAPLWQNDDSHLVENFLYKWERAFRYETNDSCDIEAYIQELENIVNALLNQ